MNKLNFKVLESLRLLIKLSPELEHHGPVRWSGTEVKKCNVLKIARKCLK